MTACNASYEPARPDGVPASATWAGGPDGGTFIECRDTEVDGVLDCTIYYDFTGDVWDQGFFLNETGVSTSDLPEQYGSFNGRKIYLELPEGADRYPTLVPSDASGRPLTERELDNRQYRLLTDV
ncbi:MAG: hypothetical protein AAF845_10215 [Bacteroidota bacterium]